MNWTKEAVETIEWDGHKFEFTIRSITYGEKMRLISDSTVTKIVNNVETLQVDNTAFLIGLLRKTIQKIVVDGENYPPNLKTIEELPPDVGDELIKRVQALSGLFRDETETE